MSFKLVRLIQRLWPALVIFFMVPLMAKAAGSEQDSFGLGMGDAVAAIAGGTHAIEWNPAGVARANVPMVGQGFGFNTNTSDFQLNTSFLYPFQDGTVFALSQFSDFPKAPGSSTTYIGSVAFPFNASRDFFLGINLKYLALSTQTSTGTESGQGLGLDLGLDYDLREPQGTIASFALAVKDVATNIRFNDTIEQPVARTFVVGAAYEQIQDTRVEMDYEVIDQTLQNSNQHNRLRLGAERFFDDRFFSVRLGYDDLIDNDGYFSFGAGYHPNQPFEISYAFRISTANSQNSNFLSFIYRFDDWGKNEGSVVETQPGGSSEINIGSVNELVQAPSTGNPVSGVPLRKMAIEIDPSVFSPTGRQKTTTISFPGDVSTDTARWLVMVQAPDSRVLRRFAGTGPLVPSFVWDGLDEDGHPVRDGKYQIALKTFGRKNNLLSDDSQVVEVMAPRSHFEIQTAGSYFSTLSAKKGKGDITFNVNSGGSPEVETWDFEISDASTNKVVFEKQGKAKLPKTVKWNGQNLEGDTASDGPYLCLMIAQDKAGNSIKTDALQIFLNNTPPDLSFKGQDLWADFAGKKPFRFNLDAADRAGISNWDVKITDETGQVLKNFKSSGQPPRDLSWDGAADDGKTVAPGSYLTAVFSATDKAGNTSITDPVGVQVDYQPPANQEQMTLNLTTVYFNASSSNLTESAKKEIDGAAASIKPYINKSILVVKGYTSPTETGDILGLSHARAIEVKKYLMKTMGLSADNVYAVGYADKEPLKSSPNAVTEDPQRRAVITLTTTQ